MSPCISAVYYFRSPGLLVSARGWGETAPQRPFPGPPGETVPCAAWVHLSKGPAALLGALQDCLLFPGSQVHGWSGGWLGFLAVAVFCINYQSIISGLREFSSLLGFFSPALLCPVSLLDARAFFSLLSLPSFSLLISSSTP